MIRYFVGPLVALVLIIAVLFGCWWLIPLALGLLALVALGYYSWRWAQRVNPAGVRAWFTQNRSRLAWAASIFMTILLLVILMACLWHRYAPDCTGGCLAGTTASASVMTPVTPEHHTTTPVASAPVVLPAPTTEVITLTTEWTDWYNTPNTPYTGRIVAGRVDKTQPYQYMLDDEQVVTVPGGVMPFQELPEFTKIRFRALVNEPPVRLVVTVCQAKDNCPK